MSTPTIHAPRTVEVGDITVAVQEYGEGEPLLVINGTSQSLGFWAAEGQVWGADRRVITYDLRGMGGSEPAGAGPITVASLAADALGLLDALGIQRTQVLGYSLGSAHRAGAGPGGTGPGRGAGAVLHVGPGRTASCGR